MDAAHAGFVALMAVIAVVAIAMFETLKAEYRQNRLPCICGHLVKDHVTALDWDSNYGDPQHRGPDYKKPGTCRKCLCRSPILNQRVPAKVPTNRR